MIAITEPNDENEKNHKYNGVVDDNDDSSASSSYGDGEGEVIVAEETTAKLDISGTASSAEPFIGEVARSIGLQGEPDDQICSNLRRELITTVNQLQYIDSIQWQQMKVPIGLVAIVREKLQQQPPQQQRDQKRKHREPRKDCCMAVDSSDDYLVVMNDRGQFHNNTTNKKKKKSSKQIGSKRESKSSSSAGSDLSSNLRPLNIPMIREMSTKESSPWGTSIHIGRSSSVGGEHSIMKKSPDLPHSNCEIGEEEEQEIVSTHRLHKIKRQRRPGLVHRLSVMFRVGSLMDFILPFDHQSTWKRGCAHALPPKQLQRYIINIAELWFIFIALFVGSILALWQTFPDVDGLDSSYGVLAIAFNFLVCVDLCLNLGALITFAVIFAIASAIHPSKIKQFNLTVIPGMQYADWSLVLGVHVFLGLMLILLYVRNAVAIDGTGLDNVNNKYLIVGMTFIVVVGLMSWIANINILGRTAFHCGLFTSYDFEPTEQSLHDFVVEGAAKDVEGKEVRKTLSRLDYEGVEHMLDKYCVHGGSRKYE